jgi:NitT/TauT family transport system permease protein/sulfonate transport system permease protein
VAAWITFICLWEVIGRIASTAKLLPPPSAIFLAGAEIPKELVRDSIATLWRVFLGYTAGGAVAIATGILVGRFAWARQTFGSVLNAFRAVPVVALVPVAITWFGLGESSKVVLVFWGVFFPVWITAVIGSDAVDQQLIWAARSLGASSMTVLLRVVLPASFGSIFGGLRAGISIGFICVAAAEMAGAQSGLGYAINHSYMGFKTERMFAALGCLTALGVGADWLFVRCVRWLAPWYSGFRR